MRPAPGRTIPAGSLSGTTSQRASGARYAGRVTVRSRITCALGIGACSAALATPATARADEVHELRHDVAVDAAVTGTAIVLVVGSELGKADLAADPCGWCEDNALDHGARRALLWRSPRAAATISDVLGFAVAPANAFGTLALAGVDAGAPKGAAGVDALLLLEAVSISAVVNQAVKLAVGRERPFVHALPPGDKGRTRHPADNNLSFYSGHTGLTMTLAAAGGTIATLRGYRLAPLVWGSGAALGAFAGYLRIAADNHWLTDVLAGALVGVAAGVLVPAVFHGRRADEPSGTLAPAVSTAPALPPPLPAGVATIGGAF
jgi:membrane-associated phospholipid phosphatase